MENMEWRVRARIVAYVDLIFSSLGLLVVFFLVLGVGALTGATVATDSPPDLGPDSKLTTETMTVLLVMLWIVAAVFVIVVCVEMWATIKLLQATDLNHDLSRALNRARIWRNVSIVMIIVSIALDLIGQSYVGLALDILIRGTMIFIVCQFIRELEGVAFGGVSHLPTLAVKV